MIEYIGIDIGGTNIRIGAIDEKEEIIFTHKEQTYDNVRTSEDLYTKIKNLIKKVPNYEDAKAIGIGAPGSVNNKTKHITISENLSLLNEFPLVEKLQKDFNKPIYIENDARVATLAEALKGCGKDKNNVCYITISTGLGGGVVINKNIYHGSSNLGAYFSKMILDGKNTSNSLISGTALINQANKQLDVKIKSTHEIFELAKSGNFIAKEIIEKFKRNLTVLLLNIATTINPDIIILGGGVIKSKEYFFEDVINNFKLEVHPLASDTIVEIATLDEPGVIGAALFAKNLNSNIAKLT